VGWCRTVSPISRREKTGRSSKRARAVNLFTNL
jgi:hypothetical protein